MSVPPSSDPPETSSSAHSNKWSEERKFLVVVVALGILTAAAAWKLTAPAHSAADPPEPDRHLINFSLTERSGRTVSRSELKDQFLVVNFVFTSCSSSCLQVNRNMAEIQRRTDGQPDVRLVSLTVDPRSDTPAVLTKYADRFGADAARWLFLTGDKSTLYGLIEASFLQRDPSDPMNLMPGGFTHAERIALVDPQGQVRKYFDGTRSSTPEAVLAEIARLRRL